MTDTSPTSAPSNSQTIDSNNSPILVELLSTNTGHQIGVITLNDPKALNALSVEMCQNISQQLAQWQTEATVVCIVLRGSGTKAFCAGGNIRKLYDSMANKPAYLGKPNAYAEAFFSNEYRLYRQMFDYTKPIVLWANGIVMGGGMGLMAMSSHRVVTETTKFAMPEISIGLYPDATGSWFLQRMPAATGLFLGLTGARCNAADALVANMANYAIASNEYEQLISQLQHANWSNNDNHYHTTSHAIAQIHHTQHLAPSNLIQHWQQIHTICHQGNIHHIDKRLTNSDIHSTDHATDSQWMSHAINNYQAGCPVSAALTFAIFKRAKHLSLPQILFMELNVSLRCADNPDFREGVRALLVDKDKQPKWSRSLAECDDSYIDAHFQSLYAKGNHPFATWR